MPMDNARSSRTRTWGTRGSSATPRSVDQAIEELAIRQHGLVTRAQLLSAGLPLHTIRSRVRTKRLRPVHRGVYQVGPVVGPRAREMAAVLACGPGSVVSHRSAAGMWQLLPVERRGASVDVTVPGRNRRRRPGIRSHRTEGFEAGDVTKLDGVPITAVARTILDLAGVTRWRGLEQAVARAEREGLTSRSKLLSLIERHARHRGVGVLRILLGGEAEPALTRSEAEDWFLGLIRKAQLPKPLLNVDVAGHQVDFYWPTARLVVEVDGYAYHSAEKRFESDRRRDARLAAGGVRVVRVTWRQIVDEPEAVVARLAQALAHPAAG